MEDAERNPFTVITWLLKMNHNKGLTTQRSLEKRIVGAIRDEARPLDEKREHRN